MHPAYLETRFEVEIEPAYWPDKFAIVTAFATTGEVWTDEENTDADRRLRGELIARNLMHFRVTGCSPDDTHREPGWAVVIGFDEARDLGRRYRQDAIYYVRGNELHVTHCESGAECVRVGCFRERVRSTDRPSDSSS
jgi:hypothetical protein